MTQTLTRSEFQNAIEYGIQQTSFTMLRALDRTLVEKLREVGRTATETMIKSFYDNEYECGCPIAQTGINRVNMPVSAFIFAAHFDQRAMDILEYSPGPSVHVRIIEG